MNVAFTPKFRMTQHLQRGFTLSELAIVLGIIGIILGAIWGAAAHVSAANNTQKAMSQVMQILNGYRSLYAQRGIDVSVTNAYGNFNDVTCMGINDGYFPSGMVLSPTPCTTTYNVQGPWPQSNVSVLTNQQYNTILIVYNNLSKAACIQFASSVFLSPNVTYEAIGDQYTGVWTNGFTPPAGTFVPLSIAQISAACGDGYTVQVGFTAR